MRTRFNPKAIEQMGDFITSLSQLDKDNIYIGVEVSPPVLALAVKKLQRYEEENNIRIDNLYFMSFDAIELSSIFNEEQIEKIYLNFSDPWPKKKHAKRRLTNEKFLEQYKKVLKEHGQIEFKTDNRGLFEYSLISLNQYPMDFEYISLDLHNSPESEGNIMTEYERKFCTKGPIYKLIGRYK